MKKRWELFLNDIKSAKWAIALVIAYFVFLRKILGSMCLMVMLTGLPCPGCGLTRAGFAVLGLDFAGAWKIHPFIYPIMLLVVAYAVKRYIFLSRDMKALNWCLVVTLAGMIVFYVWRMYWHFPGEPPMSWYEGNVMHRAAQMVRWVLGRL